MAGADVGDRWGELADAAAKRMGDHVLVFTEPHYTMAFGRTGRFDEADRQLQSLRAFAEDPKASAARLMDPLVVPLCEAVRDYYRQDYDSTVDRLMGLRYDFQPIGGSHAQRDIFALFLVDAAIRAGRLALARALLAERVARPCQQRQQLAALCRAL